MKSVYCLSFETFCLFGASVYTLSLLGRFWELIVGLVIISHTWEYYGDRNEQNPQGKVIVSCFLAIYIFFSLVLAFALFHSIEKKSPQILRGSTIVFCLIHVCEFIIQVLYWCPATADITPGAEGEKKEAELGFLRIQEGSHIAKFVVKNISAIAFVVLLFVYAKQMSMKINATIMLNGTMMSKSSRRGKGRHGINHPVVATTSKIHNNNSSASAYIDHNLSVRNQSILVP